jgi:Cu+-exporting ATPase
MWNGVALAVGVVLLAVLGPFLARELGSLPHPRQLAARAGARVVSLDVGGMTCSGCAARVKGELAAVPGVSAVEVRLRDERAVVVCDPAVADSALVSAVHRAGPGFTAARALN